jgi:ABC-2 type transport system permease protein
VIRSYVSEWLKIRRPAMILGGAGAMVGFAILHTVLALSQLGVTSGRGPFRASTLTKAQAVASSGFAKLMIGGGPFGAFVGVVALAVFSTAVGIEYSNGTLRNLLVRQPDRLRFLAGQLLALASFIALAAVVAYGVALATAVLLAPSHGVSTSAWFTGAGLQWLLSAAGDLLLATLAWGAIGAVLAIVVRSTAMSIVSGLAYALVVENLLNAAWSGGKDWLPGQLIDVILQGGTASVTYTSALLLVGLYLLAALILAGSLFQLRDVAN